MPLRIQLPRAGRVLQDYRLTGEEPLRAPTGPPPSARIAYAAAHVVIDPLAGDEAPIDMDATLHFRRYLWSLGLHVAEAMDTAQRGMGLDWTGARDLIRHSAQEARAAGGEIACGANTDQLEGAATLDRVIAAYEEQCAFIEAAGGRVILMASRALARCAQGAEDYRRVYGRVLRQLAHPAILHWLGEAFDPALAGYWGGRDAAECMENCLAVIAENRQQVDGIKISLLDKRREVEMRSRLPPPVRMYTGDDFHYPELLRGDAEGHSDALLGIFDGIAPAAALALRALDRGDAEAYDRLLTPTVPLSRHIFQAPTYHYKTGLVLLAYLNGHQRHFRMLGGQESARSVVHLAELFVLADCARLLADPELAVERMRRVLAVAGVEA
jgi:Protein of unknown function (DUF993)